MSLEHLGEIYNALKNENRIRTLQLVANGFNLSEISEELDMSYSGTHSYLSDMEDAHLVEDSNGRELTEAGEIVLNFSEQLNEQLEPVFFEMWQESVEEASEQFGIASPFTEKEVEKLSERNQNDDKKE